MPVGQIEDVEVRGQLLAPVGLRIKVVELYRLCRTPNYAECYLASLIPVGPVGVQFGVVHRHCDRPLGNSVKQLCRAASCPPRAMRAMPSGIVTEMCIRAGWASTCSY